jgi:LDH2 family malate/lactate/ureidoglycolate dehydrogenase
VGLNPIGIAVPAGEEVPYIFDASMSAVAGNKIRLLQRVGGEVLPGWVTEADGTPVMEEAPVPDDFMMLPLGGTREIGSHKGFGLAMLVEVLTSLLAGTGGGPFRRAGSAHYFMAYHVEAFTELDTFKADTDRYLRRLLECQPAPGEPRVVYPGIPEHEAELDRKKHGIPYHPEVIEWFKTTCDSLQVTHRL